MIDLRHACQGSGERHAASLYDRQRHPADAPYGAGRDRLVTQLREFRLVERHDVGNVSNPREFWHGEARRRPAKIGGEKRDVDAEVDDGADAERIDYRRADGLSGPNAIRLEIAYDGPGYVLAISQQVDLLRWRVSGIDTIRQPLMMVTSHIKRMDSRHWMLDQLAEYAEQPVAPLRLIVAEMPESLSRGGGSRDFGFTPNWDNAILLPGIEIYRRPEDRPPHTMARTEAEFEARTKNGPDPGWPPAPEQAPASIASARERRLAASMPKTLHVLRNTHRGAALLEQALALGCARWQVEQAICNLRSADFLAYQPSGAGKRLAMIDTIRHHVLEPASMDVDLTAISNDQISAQIGLDSAFLLRRLEPDREIGDAVVERIERIRELGYG